MPRIRPIKEEYNSSGEFVPPNPYGHEVSIGREMQGGDDENMEMDLQADIGTNPIPALDPIDERASDISSKVDDIINKIFKKLGIAAHPQLIKGGQMGYAYTDGNRVYKLTTDYSEATESQKLVGKVNKCLADVYAVHQIRMDELNTKTYLIILEQLKTESDKFGRLENDLDALFGRVSNTELISMLEFYRDYRQDYDKLYETKLKSELDKYPLVNQYWHSLLMIMDELKKYGIKSLDLHHNNLGYKKNGNLGFFDMGYSYVDTPANVDVMQLENSIFERVLTYMKGASAVAVKKKCQIGGNGDGTSTACNQGDINNLELNVINEVQNIVNSEMEKFLKESITVYHGTQNKFDKFSSDKIGSSSGKELGGWGIYFTDNYDVARQYLTNGGGVIEADLRNGQYLNFDEVMDENLVSFILSKGLRNGLSDEDLEQFQSDYNDDNYRYDITNKQLYDWLAGCLGGSKQASLFLKNAGYIGNIFTDKTNRDATNYVVFDPTIIRNNGYVDNNDEVDENVQMLDKNLINTQKLTQEDKERIMSITHGDNYTYFIGCTYEFYVRGMKSEEQKSAFFNNGNTKKTLIKIYDDVKTYNPNVFPIVGYDPYLKTIHLLDMLECLDARRFCIKIISQIPTVYLRNLREDIRLPRDRTYMKYDLESDLKEIRRSMETMDRLSPEKKEMYYKKMFSSQFTTFKQVKNNLEKLDILFLNHDSGIEEIRDNVRHLAAKILYDKNNILVVDVLSSEAMKELGCGSTWCFAIESGDQYWQDYANDSHVNLIYNFNLAADDKERMCVFLPDGELYNMYNEPADHGYLTEIGVTGVLNAQSRIRRKAAKAFNEVQIKEDMDGFHTWEAGQDLAGMDIDNPLENNQTYVAEMAQMFLKQLIEEGKHTKVEYGAAMLNFKIKEWSRITSIIEKDDVYDVPTFGVEKDAHITILYGFHDGVDIDEVKKKLNEVHDLSKPISVELTKVSMFEGKHTDYDVVKFDVKCDILHKMNKVLREFPHTSSFPDYHPHMTIAYVKKGRAKKYVRTLKSSIKLKSDHIVFSTKTQKKTVLNENFAKLGIFNENQDINVNSLQFKGDIERAGGKIYSVGGAVRDGLIGKPSKDLDLLITGLPLNQIESILAKYGRVDNVGKSFGVLKFNDPKLGELDIAIPRTEKANGQGGYQGFDVTSDHTLPIEKDLERRDFTINAIARDSDGTMIDPYNGQEDLKNKIIRMVNPAAFQDDPLRMIRAVQFAARFGFTIEPATLDAIKLNASRIKEISPERILSEFDKIVKKGSPTIAAKILTETGLYENIFGGKPHINYSEMEKVKTMGEFIFVLASGAVQSPSEFYKTKLKGDLDTYSEIRAYEMAYKAPAKANDVQTKLTIFGMFKTYPKSLESGIIPNEVKENISEMQKSNMPFSMKDLQINGNDLLALGYTGQQIGDLMKKLIVDIYSGKLQNSRELLLRHLTPLNSEV